jgi:high affinity Mn2+ porin
MNKKIKIVSFAFFALMLNSLVSSGMLRADDAPVPLAGEKPNTLQAEPSKSSDWSNHFQMTLVSQLHGSFNAPYSGQLSLKPSFEDPTSLTATLFVGHRLWKNAYAFINPEEAAGAGLSQTHGIAAFPNGEIYRVDDPSPKTNLSRLFFQQDFEMGGGKEQLEDEPNVFGDMKDMDRITLVAGKFSLNDYFDDNTYSHDPRTQFMNWGLMDTAAWDYAADTRGYTWGLFLQYRLATWSFKFATVEVPVSANGLDMDGNIVHAHGDNAEIEYRYQLGAHPGRLRLMGYMNHANMGNYRTAIAQAASSGTTPDITATRSYSTKYGSGLNWEQEITPDLGIFSRIGWNDGATETWAFTEVDSSFSLGVSLKGTRWSRVDDVFGFAVMIDGLSKDHADYLSAGGIGFIVGDGPAAGAPQVGPYLSYAPEYVLETYYLCKITRNVGLTADFQYVNNPGYNSSRGPVPIVAGRVHLEL